MPLNLQNRKIPTFVGINNSPVAPTPTSAGNASHLIAQYNGLIDLLESSFSNFFPEAISSLEAGIENLSDQVSDLQSSLENFGTPPVPDFAFQAIQTSDFSAQIDAGQAISLDLSIGQNVAFLVNSDYVTNQNISLAISNPSIGQRIHFSLLKGTEANVSLFFGNNYSLEEWPDLLQGWILFVDAAVAPTGYGCTIIKLQSLIYEYQPS